MREEEETWKIVLDQMTARDKETIDGWKDELNSLLIFVSVHLDLL